jgi:HEAT repeat protein
MMRIDSVHRLPLVGLLAILVGCGGDGVDALVAALQSADVETRREAARQLGEHAAANADERLIAALTLGVADRDVEVRRLSVDALGAVGPAARSSLEALKLALNDPEPVLRVRTALAIQRIAPQDESFVPVLVGAMRSGEGPVLLEVGAMGEEGAWAVPMLIRLLSHEKAQMRALAAQTLGRVGVASRDVTGALQRGLGDSNPAVQAAARKALEQIEADTAGR